MENLFRPNRLVFFEGSEKPKDYFVPDVEKVSEPKTEEALKPKTEKSPETFDNKIKACLASIDGEAKSYEEMAKKEGRFFGMGNLGDNWIPAIDELNELFKNKMDSVDGKDKKAEILRKARGVLLPVIRRFEKYLDFAEEQGSGFDADCWSTAVLLKESLGMKVDRSKLAVREAKTNTEVARRLKEKIEVVASGYEKKFEQENWNFEEGQHSWGYNWVEAIDHLLDVHKWEYSPTFFSANKATVAKQVQNEMVPIINRLENYLRKVEAKTNNYSAVATTWDDLEYIKTRLQLDFKVK